VPNNMLAADMQRSCPCDACAKRDECRDRRIACGVFARFCGAEVKGTGPLTREPSRTWYRKLFTD